MTLGSEAASSVTASWGPQASHLVTLVPLPPIQAPLSLCRLPVSEVTGPGILAWLQPCLHRWPC